MESDGARTYSVPAKSRHQVLRPGVRIVVVPEIEPYDDSPYESLYCVLGVLRFTAHSGFLARDVYVLDENGLLFNIPEEDFPESIELSDNKLTKLILTLGDTLTIDINGDQVEITGVSGEFFLSKEIADRM